MDADTLREIGVPGRPAPGAEPPGEPPAATPDDAFTHAQNILGLDIKGHVVKRVMVAHFEGWRNYTEEAKILTFDGQLRDVIFSVTYPTPPEQQDTTFITITDITERLRTEAQLRQLQADFAQRLGGKTRINFGLGALARLGFIERRGGHICEGPLLDLAVDYNRVAPRILNGALADLLGRRGSEGAGKL